MNKTDNIKAVQLLENLTLDYPYLSITSVEDGLNLLDGKQEYMEAVHIHIEPFSPQLYPPKKKYFNMTKYEKPSKLDEWIYQITAVKPFALAIGI